MELVKRARAAAGEGAQRLVAVAIVALPDVVGLCGLALCVAGVAENWGRGWALIAGGGPLLAAYAWRELRSVIGSRRN